jgi:hypothetical protein
MGNSVSDKRRMIDDARGADFSTVCSLPSSRKLPALSAFRHAQHIGERGIFAVQFFF